LIAVCALPAVAATAAAETPAAILPSNNSPWLVDQVFLSALDRLPLGEVSWGHAPAWDLELPSQLTPFWDSAANGVETCSSLLYLRVSSEYLSRRFAKDVHRTKPVTDLILGTRIRGESLTRGKTRLVLIPNDDRFVAEIEFTGTVDSRTRGTNGPAILHYKSASTFRAHKRFTIDAHGLSVNPARATAKTRLQPLRIESRTGGLVGMIVERVARRRVAETSAQANAIAADHTADIVAGDLDRGFDKSIGALTAALAEAAGLKPSELAQLTTSGAGHRLHLMLRTTRDHAELVLSPERVSWTELATILPIVDGSSHVALRVHRSILTSTGANSSGSPALARLLAHGMQTQLAKRSAAVVELPAQANEQPIEWSVDLNWLCIDVCRAKPQADAAFRSAQVEVEPPRPSLGGGQ